MGGAHSCGLWEFLEPPKLLHHRGAPLRPFLGDLSPTVRPLVPSPRALAHLPAAGTNPTLRAQCPGVCAQQELQLQAPPRRLPLFSVDSPGGRPSAQHSPVWPTEAQLPSRVAEPLAGEPPGGWGLSSGGFVLAVQVDGILKTVLRDEIIAWHKKTQEDTSSPLSAAGQPENMDSQQLVSLVQKAVTAIMTRLHNLAQFEGGESKVNTLVAAANSLDNLCRMDPAWHPWL